MLHPHRLQVEYIRYPLCNRIAWCEMASDKVVAVFRELELSVSRSGCSIEDFAVSPSGEWIVTRRCSGQGEWGYDVIRSESKGLIVEDSGEGYTPGVLERVAGIEERRGYTFDVPTFAPDESFLLGGYGENWLGGWWVHPDDDAEEPSRGGEFTFGWLFKHHLPSHRVTWHELKMSIPAVWFPEDFESTKWYGAQSIEPLGDGVKMILAGDIPFEFSGPLPETIRVPTPHPGGGKFLEQ